MNFVELGKRKRTKSAGCAEESEGPILVALLGVFFSVLGDGDELGDCDAVEVAEGLQYGSV